MFSTKLFITIYSPLAASPYVISPASAMMITLNRKFMGRSLLTSALKYNSRSRYNSQRNVQLNHSVKSEEQLEDLKVHNSLSKISRFVKDGRDQRRTKHPYKIKQLRYTRHIMNLVNKGKASEAGEVFELMKKARVKPEVVVYNTLIAGYGRQGNSRESFRLFNQMKKHGVIPTDHTYTSMLSACAETGPRAVSILDKVEKEMERRNVRLNNIGMNAHISALASCQRHQDALKVYLDMTKVGVSPDIHTYSGLLLASARDPIGGMIVAQQVWQEMEGSGCESDLYIYNLLLQCLRDAGLEGIQVHKPTSQTDMQIFPPLNLVCIEKDTHRNSTVLKNVERASKCTAKTGPTNDKRMSQFVRIRRTGGFDFVLKRDQKLTVNLGYIIKSDTSKELSKDQSKDPPTRWLENESVDILFQLLKRDDLKTDIRMFNLLIQLVLDPSPLLRRMEVYGIPLDERVILTAVRVQALLGSMKGAEAVLSYSKSHGVNVGQAGYQAVATCCSMRKDGLALLDEMKESGMVPNEFVFGTLIGNALRNRSYEYVTSLLKKMRHFEVIPNETVMEMLETAANRKPKSPSHVRRHNGFKGYYSIWKKLMSYQDYDSHA